MNTACEGILTSTYLGGAINEARNIRLAARHLYVRRHSMDFISLLARHERAKR